MTRTTIVVAAALALAVTPPAASAQVQSIRTFVSVAGSDSNPCTITQPCRHFSAAVAATALGGEVDALDPGAYGSFAIGQAISIEGQGWSYVAPPANGAAITINANSGDNVNIHGVSFNGVGVAEATGIQFNSGGTLNVQNCVIRNFSFVGIAFQPNSSTLSQLYVSNTLVSDNGGGGIDVQPTGSGTTIGVLDRVQIENNNSTGLYVSTSTQTMNVTVTDSVIANNALFGIFGNSTNGTHVSIMVRNSTIANNPGYGLQAGGTNATIRLTRSTITGSTTAWGTISNGVVLSYADNNIDGNTDATTAPPCVNGTSPCTAYQ
jgi:hypothetical protein